MKMYYFFPQVLKGSANNDNNKAEAAAEYLTVKIASASVIQLDTEQTAKCLLSLSNLLKIIFHIEFTSICLCVSFCVTVYDCVLHSHTCVCMCKNRAFQMTEDPSHSLSLPS